MTDFVFTIISVPDLFDAHQKKDILCVTQREYFADNKRMSDYYEDEELEELEAAFNQIGVQAFEATESQYEFEGMTASQLRSALSALPNFEDSADFAAFLR